MWPDSKKFYDNQDYDMEGPGEYREDPAWPTRQIDWIRERFEEFIRSTETIEWLKATYGGSARLPEVIGHWLPRAPEVVLTIEYTTLLYGVINLVGWRNDATQRGHEPHYSCYLVFSDAVEIEQRSGGGGLPTESEYNELRRYLAAELLQKNTERQGLIPPSL